MEHPNFFWSYSSNDYICIFFKRNKKAFLFPIKQFFAYIVVPFKFLLFILITLKTVKICGGEEENLKGRSKTLSSVKEEKSLLLFLNWILSVYVKLSF